MFSVFCVRKWVVVVVRVDSARQTFFKCIMDGNVPRSRACVRLRSDVVCYRGRRFSVCQEKGLGPFGLAGVTRQVLPAKVTARTPRRCVNCKYYNKVNVTTGKSVTTPRLALVCVVWNNSAVWINDYTESPWKLRKVLPFVLEVLAGSEVMNWLEWQRFWLSAGYSG